jgi:hypothetical protein
MVIVVVVGKCIEYNLCIADMYICRKDSGIIDKMQ